MKRDKSWQLLLFSFPVIALGLSLWFGANKLTAHSGDGADSSEESSKEPPVKVKSAIKNSDQNLDGNKLPKSQIEELEMFLKKESAQLRLPSSGRSLEELDLKAKSFSSDQVKRLFKVVQDLRRGQDQRVLAVYMLGKVGGTSINMLESFVRDFRPPGLGQDSGHGLESVKGKQELALRVMAVDALFDRASSDSGSLNSINNIYRSTDSQTLRNYIRQQRVIRGL